MAHKGKFYPVLLRRDWNLNVQTNRVGFANRYILTPKYGVTGFGTLPAARIWDVGPADDSVFGTMRWASPSLNIGPFTFHFIVISTIDPGGATYTSTIQEYEDHVGLILTAEIGPPGTHGVNFAFLTPSAVIYFDPTFFDGKPFMDLFKIRQKLWSDGVPH